MALPGTRSPNWILNASSAVVPFLVRGPGMNGVLTRDVPAVLGCEDLHRQASLGPRQRGRRGGATPTSWRRSPPPESGSTSRCRVSSIAVAGVPRSGCPYHAIGRAGIGTRRRLQASSDPGVSYRIRRRHAGWRRGSRARSDRLNAHQLRAVGTGQLIADGCTIGESRDPPTDAAPPCFRASRVLRWSTAGRRARSQACDASVRPPLTESICWAVGEGQPPIAPRMLSVEREGGCSAPKPTEKDVSRAAPTRTRPRAAYAATESR